MSSTESTVPTKCLKCQAEQRSPIVCTGCQTLYPIPQSADYFDLLGIPRSYSIDEDKLAAAFRAITRNIHPDRFSGQPSEVGNMAIRLSAELNQAITVLKDPVQRASYLLELCGGPSAAEVREVPGDLLAEVMTLGEQIDQARETGDHAAIKKLRIAVKARRLDTLQKVSGLASQVVTSSEHQKTELRRMLNSIKYFENLLAQLTADPLEQTSEAGDG